MRTYLLTKDEEPPGSPSMDHHLPAPKGGGHSAAEKWTGRAAAAVSPDLKKAGKQKEENAARDGKQEGAGTMNTVDAPRNTDDMDASKKEDNRPMDVTG